MLPAQARGTILNTDYPIDKVIYRSAVIPVAISSFGFNDISVPNPLGVKFLPIAQFSLDPTFETNVYDENSGPWSGGFEMYSTAVYITASEIKITTNNNTAPAVTLYFRIIGLPIKGSTLDYPHTSGYEPFVFNTDDNYMKLYLSDMRTLATTASFDISHNLGYKPRCLFWADYAQGLGLVTFVSADYVAGGYTVIPRVGNTGISVQNMTFATVDVHYRVYIED